MATRYERLGICMVFLLILAVVAVLPQAAVALNATYEASGNGTLIASRYYAKFIPAQIFKMNVSGTIYDAYCVDLYTNISQDDNLTVNGSLAEGDPTINWTAVIYILNKYNYSSPLVQDKDREAAAIQAALWYFTSESFGKFNTSWIRNSTFPHYPKYQFMSDGMTGAYDGYNSDAGNNSVIRDRAFVIINDTKENGTDFKFPTTIDLTPEKNLVNASESITITATVYDQNDDPLPGITVKFSVTEGNGTLNTTSGTTNDPGGQVHITFTASDPPDNSKVVAWIEGNYGTLLRGDILYVDPVQNVSTVTIIPRSIEDYTIIAPIPELSTAALLGTGMLALFGYVLNAKKKRRP